MKAIFVDTFLWVAMSNPNDPWHERARVAYRLSINRPLLTTEEVLCEFLTSLSGTPYLRSVALQVYARIANDPRVSLVAQSSASFQMGLSLYSKRPDKQYSLTDCVSMETMRSHSIKQVLTNDHHFTQEGFEILIL